MTQQQDSTRVFRELMCAHRRAHDALFDSMGLREIGQPILMAILSDKKRAGEKCTQKELSERLRISPSTLTISIKSLEKRGYVRKTTDETDLRRNYIEITEDGMEISNKCRECLIGIDEAMYAGFTQEEKEQAMRLMERMAENLRTLCGKDCEKNV